MEQEHAGQVRIDILHPPLPDACYSITASSLPNRSDKLLLPDAMKTFLRELAIVASQGRDNVNKPSTLNRQLQRLFHVDDRKNHKVKEDRSPSKDGGPASASGDEDLDDSEDEVSPQRTRAKYSSLTLDLTVS